MNFKLWLMIHTFVIGCVTIEIGIFLQRLDSALTQKLATPQNYNNTAFFRELAAYCFNIKRLLRLFKLKRENIMDSAKTLYSSKHPTFIRNFSCEKVKTDFKMTDREYKDLIHFAEKITGSLTEFYDECEANPGFVGIPVEPPQCGLQKTSALLTLMFKNPSSRYKKHQIFKAVEEYYYLLGKMTKKFKLGRRTVMDRAKALFESGGPSQFLRYYDFYKMQKMYFLTTSEAATLDSNIRGIQKRYWQFTSACARNPNFECKIDFSSVDIARHSDRDIQDILSNPTFLSVERLFKGIRDLYHVFGFFRRHNIPHRDVLLHALNKTFGLDCPAILKPLDFDKIKVSLGLNDSRANELEENIGHLRRRFFNLQKIYLNPNASDLPLVS